MTQQNPDTPEPNFGGAVPAEPQGAAGPAPVDPAFAGQQQPQQSQQPQQWAWAQPQQVMAPVETEPLEYHRLYRGAPKYAWWKPIVVVALAASIYFAMNIGFSLLMFPLLNVFDTDYLGVLLTGQGDLLDTQHPLSILLNLVTVALMIPAVVLAMLALGIRPTGRVWSVAGKIRWSLVWRTMGAAVLAIIAMNTVGVLGEMILAGIVESDPVPPAFESPDFSVTAAVTSFALVLLLVPFQATAEEVVFRGLFLQVLGSWMKSPWIAIVLSTIAFAAGHIYDIWGLLAVGLMGLVAAWLTWKTGGLEAAISIHIVNNIVAFGFMTSGLAGETAQVESSGGVMSVVGEVVGLAVFVWLTMRIFRKHGYGRERVDVVLRPMPLQPNVVRGGGIA